MKLADSLRNLKPLDDTEIISNKIKYICKGYILKRLYENAINKRNQVDILLDYRNLSSTLSLELIFQLILKRELSLK